MKKIFVDAGHGGYDNGAVGNKMIEKQINLNVALKVKELLKYNGFDVMMTRDTDIFVDLAKRSQMSNAYGADLFISIHHNAGGGDGYEVIHSIVVGEDDTFANILGKQFEGIGQNKRAIYTRAGTYDKTKDYYAVLRNTTCPVRVISEFAYLDTADYLAIDTIQEQHNEARAIVKAICEFFGVAFKDPVLLQDAITIIKAHLGLSDSTIDYLKAYQYGYELIIKIASNIQ